MYYVTYIIEDMEAKIPMADMEQAQALQRHLATHYQIQAEITPCNSTQTESLPNTSTQT